MLSHELAELKNLVEDKPANSVSLDAHQQSAQAVTSCQYLEVGLSCNA